MMRRLISLAILLQLYVRSERDGLIYQCVPQPGNVAGGTRSAAEYGYQAGVIHGSPGYLRIPVEKELAAVEFIRTAIEDRANPRRDAKASEANASVVHRYEIVPSVLTP